MKINLGLSEDTVIKTFSYDIDNQYEQTIIGKKYYSEASIQLLPNFIGQTKEYVQNYASSHNLQLTIEYVEDTTQKAGTVISQDPGEKMDLSEMSSNKGLKITVAQGGTTSFDYTSCTKEEYKDNINCKLTNFTGKTYEQFVNWLSS